MENERSSVITIGGEQYEMVLTTRATKAISIRYGGLDNLGDKLMKSENMEMALDEIVWLITLLCNQGIQIHNLKSEDMDLYNCCNFKESAVAKGLSSPNDNSLLIESSFNE